MNIEDLGEFGLIDQIRRSFSQRSKRAPIGIGDDAAALSVSPGQVLLATADMLVEGVHFDLSTTDFRSLGWKSAAVNLSDIAAMGGVPRFCLIALAIPRHITVEQISAFYHGCMDLLKKHKVLLVGGDTCSSKRDFVITVTLLGETPKRQVLTRSGARPGDLIFVTGTLGDSAAGLEMLSNGIRERGAARRIQSKLVEKHLRPEPRVQWGRKLAMSGLVSSMIDVSDGLSSDLGHICEESGVGAELYSDRLPLSESLRRAKGLNRPPEEYACSGGEDYELLFTAPTEHENRIIRLGVEATVIGAITGSKRVRIRFPSGEKRPFEPLGYDHFRTARRGTHR